MRIANLPGWPFCPIFAVVFIACVVIAMPLPPLHVYQRFGLGTLVASIVTDTSS
jgi:hypothetical protein